MRRGEEGRGGGENRSSLTLLKRMRNDEKRPKPGAR
jgi:hypothetical protein